MLSELKLTNWRCHESLSWSLNGVQPVHLVLGANEAGKSAIRQAIEFALRDTVAGVQKKDRKARLVRHGASGCKVEVAIVPAAGKPLTIVRTMTTCSAAPAEIRAAVGDLDDRQLRAALDSSRFVGLSPADRQALMVDVLGTDLAADRIEKELLADGIGGVLAEEAAERVMAEGWKKAEAWAIEQRRESGRDAESAAAVTAPAAEIEHAGERLDVSRFDRAAIEAMQGSLAKIQAERDALMQERGAAKIGRTPAEIEPVLADARKRLAEIRVTKDLEELASRKKALEADSAEWTRKAEASRADMRKAEDALRNAKESFKALEDMRDGMPCPAFPGLRCKPDKDQIQSISEKLLKQMADAEREISVKVRAVPAGMERVAALNSQISQIGEEIAKASAAAREVGGLQRTIADLEAELADSAQVDLEAMDKRLSDYDRRIARGRAVIAGARAYRDAEEAVNRSKTQAEAARIDRAVWDVLAKALAPDGIQGRIASGAGEKFFQRLAETSSQLLGRPIRVDESWEIWLGADYVGPTPETSDVSRSTHLAASVLLQDAVCQALGFRLLLVDDVDTFQGKRRQGFFRVVDAIRKDYDRVLVWAASSKDDPDPIPLDWVQTWHLTGGQLKAVPIR